MHREDHLKRLFRVSVCLLLLLMIVPSTVSRASSVDDLLARMTLEERVGQLFVIDFWGLENNSSIMQLLTTIHPAGAVLIDQNLDTPQQITALTNSLQTASIQNGTGIPLLIMTDQEGGTVQRLRDGFTRLPNPLLLGAITDRTLIVNYGRMIGQELAAVGVNMDLAPVVDLATNPSNSVLEDRMMSDDPERVRDASEALVEGLTQAGVIGVLKHFPGHGEVLDTHVNRGILPFSTSRLNSMELVPFVGAHSPVIMLGHISAPALDPSGLPATLSGKMINFLRDQGSYDGALMTDAMDMGAIINNYTLPDAAVQAVKAGVNLILLGAHTSNADQIAAYQAVLNAVKSGAIPESRLNAAVRRVLSLKADYHLLSWTPLPESGVDRRISLADGAGALAALYRGALTVVKNNGNLLPITPDKHVVIIYPNLYPNLGQMCKIWPNVELLPVNHSPVAYQLSLAAALAKRSDVVVVFTEDAINNLEQQNLVAVLPPGKVVVVALKSPYDLRVLPDTAGYVLAYAPIPPAFQSACAGLFGEQETQGVVPVILSNQHPTGQGIVLKSGTF